MKKIFFTIVFSALVVGWVGFVTGCLTPANERVAAVHTLQAVGQSAKTAMDATTQLLKQGAISVEQWQRAAFIYDVRFQSAYDVAIAAARSDLSTPASADLVAIAAELTNLVGSYMRPASTVRATFIQP